MEELVELTNRAVERPYDIPLNVAVWIAFKPMIKIYISIGTGFFLVKYKVLTPELSKGLSRLVLLVFMPCLIFNNIVAQIKDTDIKLFGVVVFSGFIYYVVGLGWGILTYMVTPVPRAWIGGLILCCMINNCSDLPLAYVQTIGESPFLPASAAARGVSYSVLIVIIFVIFTFNLDGTRLVEWDFTRDDPRPEDPTIPPFSYENCKRLVRRWTGHETEADRKYENEIKEEKLKDKELTDHEKDEKFNDEHKGTSTDSSERNKDPEEQSHNSTNRSSDPGVTPYNEDTYMSQIDSELAPEEGSGTIPSSEAVLRQDIDNTQNDRDDFSRASTRMRAQNERPYGSTDVYYSRRYSEHNENNNDFSDARSRLSSMDEDAPVGFQNLQKHMSRTGSVSSSKSKSKKPNVFQKGWRSFKRGWFRFKGKHKVNEYICNFCEDIFLPQMMALIAGITVCMIPWVRRVFVKGQNIKHFHDAPDKNPPLDFLMEFLSFFAGAQVPLGLMLLGGTMGSLKIGKTVPGFWKTLVMITIFKLAILPIIACGWIHRIREIGWLSKDDAMTPIVLAVASGTPSATVQIYLTIAWIDPTKESPVLNSLAIALMAQYVFLPISMTFLVTYVVMHWV